MVLGSLVTIIVLAVVAEESAEVFRGRRKHEDGFDFKNADHDTRSPCGDTHNAVDSSASAVRGRSRPGACPGQSATSQHNGTDGGPRGHKTLDHAADQASNNAADKTADCPANNSAERPSIGLNNATNSAACG